MRIKDIPETERPQEKLRYHGTDALSSAELLALILRTGSRKKSAVQLAEDVLATTATMSGDLMHVEVEELMAVDGIGISKACSIIAAMELARRMQYAPGMIHRSGRNAGEIAEFMMEELRDEKQEHLIALLLNVKCEIESKVTISIGELCQTSIHPRDVFRPAIRKSAAGIVLVHNHPSGDPTPSAEDIASTRRLQEVSKVVGIRLLDHLIIGDRRYVSLRAEGVMERMDE